VARDESRQDGRENRLTRGRLVRAEERARGERGRRHRLLELQPIEAEIRAELRHARRLAGVLPHYHERNEMGDHARHCDIIQCAAGPQQWHCIK
jgi:hypothetical protein